MRERCWWSGRPDIAGIRAGLPTSHVKASDWLFHAVPKPRDFLSVLGLMGVAVYRIRVR